MNWIDYFRWHRDTIKKTYKENMVQAMKNVAEYLNTTVCKEHCSPKEQS